MMGAAVPLTEGGIEAALARVAKAVGAPPGASRAQQLALIPTGATAEPDPGVAPEHRGPGRPKGATNKRTEEWTEYLLRRYASPLIGLAETYSRPLIELAREIAAIAGVPNLTVSEVIELLRVQEAAKVALAPYLHSKQPIALEVEGGLVPLFFGVTPEMARLAQARAAGAGPVVVEAEVLDQKTAENRQFSQPDSPELEGPRLERDEERPADAAQP
jgi:hypothetical protein